MSNRSAIRIGIAGWSYADWAGIVYPSQAGRGTRDPLRIISNFVDLIEINSSFYRIPNVHSTRAWLERTSDRSHLQFSAKAPSSCTHERSNIDVEARAFREALAPLYEAGKLLAVVAQYPFFFEPGPKERAALQELAAALYPWPTVFELRAAGWLADEERAFLRQEGLNLACVDMPGDPHGAAREIAGQGAQFYLRLHGRNGQAWFRKGSSRDQAYDHLYQPADLMPWLERAQAARSRGLPASIITNNHFRGQALVNAVQMRSILAGAPLHAPATLLERYPQLVSFASAVGATGERSDNQTTSLFEGWESEE